VALWGFFIFIKIMAEYYKDLSLENLFYTDEFGVLQEEKWKDVLHYEGLYQTSNLARMKSLGKLIYRSNCVKPVKREPMIMVQFLNKRGYLRICLRDKNKTKKSFSVHRLVAEVFIPNPENKPYVNHKGKIPNTADNRVWMIEWATHPENEKHAVENGLKAYGVRHGQCKLTEKDVLEIRAIGYSQMQTITARKYGIGKSQVGRILRREIWKNLP